MLYDLIRGECSAMCKLFEIIVKDRDTVLLESSKLDLRYHSANFFSILP